MVSMIVVNEKWSIARAAAFEMGWGGGGWRRGGMMGDAGGGGCK